jgi:hypothetical protein
MEMLPLALLADAGENIAVNEVFCPGLRVSGTVKPLMLKPVPEALAAEIVKGPVPGLVNVTVCNPLMPTRTFPKLTLEGLAVSCPCTPAPLSEIVVGEFVALLMTTTLPVTLPATVGANNTFSVTDWLGGRVVLAPTPLTLNPTPAAVRFETVTFEFPVFVSVAGRELLPPTFKLPKLRLDGLAASKKVGAPPVPLSAIVRGEPGTLLVIEMLPAKLPADVGENVAVKGAVCPGLRIRGTVKPVMLKPVPEALAAEIVTPAVPEFVRVTDTEPLLPMRRLPKLTLEGLAMSWPCVPVPLRATVMVGLVALLVIVMLPEAFPAAVGEN